MAGYIGQDTVWRCRTSIVGLGAVFSRTGDVASLLDGFNLWDHSFSTGVESVPYCYVVMSTDPHEGKCLSFAHKLGIANHLELPRQQKINVDLQSSEITRDRVSTSMEECFQPTHIKSNPN